LNSARPEADAMATVLLANGGSLALPIEAVDRVGAALEMTGAAGSFAARARWTPASDGDHADVALTIEHRGGAPIDAAVRVALRVCGAGSPRWLVPACFYGENRPAASRARYPRWDPASGDSSELVSDRWSFRSDRAALAAVAVTNERVAVAIAGDEEGEAGLGGIGFGGRAGDATIWLDAPYREEPVSYVGAVPGPPDRPWLRWEPGRALRLEFSAAATGAGPGATTPFLRTMVERHRAANPLAPWVTPREAAALAAEGLVRWHYQPEHGVLYETAAFDRQVRDADGAALDRPNMHVAWVSGAPYAAALLRYGRATGNRSCVEAGRRVLDTVASGLAPCGAFWGEWRGGRWTGGWNPDPSWLHTRTLAEATLFMLRALRWEAESPEAARHPAWERAVRSNLAFIAARQRADGNLGMYYKAGTGDVTEWQSAAGLLWAAALCEGAALLGDRSLLPVAERAGAYYARFVDDEFLCGAPEDVHLTPTSEDGYNAVIAYVALHAATGDERWLDLARRAADWTLTFRYAYNVRFSPETLLGAYDFRTRGADMASPANQHLHAYGLVCLPEMLRLARLTGDGHFLERTRDNLACFLQFVARRDGDFNARRGMVSERYHQTDWVAPKGSVLTLSHAWSVGLLLYAAHHAMEDPDSVPA
jgi:hypothetical protein